MERSREEVFALLQSMDPAEQVMKKLYERKLDWSRLSEEQGWELYCLFWQEKEGYSYLREAGRIDQSIHLFEKMKKRLSREEFALLFKGKAPKAAKALQGESMAHMHKTRYFAQKEENTEENVRILKHARYSDVSMHDHDFIEMAYMLTGSACHTFIIDNRRVEYELTKGDTLLIPPGMSHSVEIYNETDIMINILINRETFQEAFFRDLPVQNILFEFFCNIILLKNSYSNLIFHTKDRGDVRDILLDMIGAYLCEDEIHAKICEHYLSIFFLKLVECSTPASLEVSAKAKKAADQMIPIMTYIRKNYSKATLRSVADEFHFSVTYINRIFKNYTGSTVAKYIQEQRLLEAERLLRESRLSVEEICCTVGYQDVSYFIEIFKKKNGVTPHQYRGFK